MTDRGVSTAVNYVLALAVVTLLVSGLFVSMSGFVTDQQEQAVRSELTVVGNRLADDLSAADRLAVGTGGTGRVRATLDLPESVAGTTYRTRIASAGGGDSYTLTLVGTDPEVSVTVSVRTRTTVATGTVTGGDLVVTYDDANDRLEVSNA